MGGLALVLITIWLVISWLHFTTTLVPAQASVANMLYAVVCGLSVAACASIWWKWGPLLLWNSNLKSR